MLRTSICIGCQGEFQYDYRTGPPRQRCEPCRSAHKKEQDRIKSQRWKDANREKHVEYLRQYHQARKDDPDYRQRRTDNMMRYTYGIDRAEFDRLAAAQGGVCAICKGPPNGPGKRLHIDHCHNSNRIRGLLCGKCNTAVGLLDDDPERAETLAAYLRL